MYRYSILFFVLLILAVTTQAQQLLKQPDYKKISAPIPPFVLKRPNGTTFTNENLRRGVPTVFFIFSPTCDHCEKVMDTLKRREADFKTAQFVFVAEERQRPYMKDFLSRTGLQKDPFFRNLGFDGGNLIYFLYQYQALPQLNVYNRNGRLAHTFTTTIPLDSLRTVLR